MNKIVLYQKALEKWGAEHQTIKASEELSELNKELCKRMLGAANHEQLAEEIADVLIMMEQLMMIYDNRPKVAGYKLSKLMRLARNLGGEYNGDLEGL